MEKELIEGFESTALKHFKVLGKWKSYKTGFITDSLKIKYKNYFSFCAPDYAVNKGQLRLSKRHSFWVVFNKKIYDKLDLHSKHGVYKKNRLVLISAVNLMELIKNLEYLNNLKNLEWKQKMNNIKEARLVSWLHKKIYDLAEKITNCLLKSFKMNELYKTHFILDIDY